MSFSSGVDCAAVGSVFSKVSGASRNSVIPRREAAENGIFLLDIFGRRENDGRFCSSLFGILDTGKRSPETEVNGREKSRCFADRRSDDAAVESDFERQSHRTTGL